MQSLSHYSYHVTNRKLLFCDLQGGVYKNGFVITDPVIMSITQEYGPTDLGSEGISTFFARHKCNEYCNKNWVMPHDKKVYFKVQKGSAMVVPIRRSRTPLTGSSLAGTFSTGSSIPEMPFDDIPVQNGIDSGYGSMDPLPALVEGLELEDE